MSLKTPGIILGNTHVHIVLPYFLSSKIPFALCWNYQRQIPFFWIPWRVVCHGDSTPLSIEVHLTVRNFKINPERLNTLDWVCRLVSQRQTHILGVLNMKCIWNRILGTSRNGEPGKGWGSRQQRGHCQADTADNWGLPRELWEIGYNIPYSCPSLRTVFGRTYSLTPESFALFESLHLQEGEKCPQETVERRMSKGHVLTHHPPRHTQTSH